MGIRPGRTCYHVAVLLITYLLVVLLLGATISTVKESHGRALWISLAVDQQSAEWLGSNPLSLDGKPCASRFSYEIIAV